MCVKCAIVVRIKYRANHTKRPTVDAYISKQGSTTLNRTHISVRRLCMYPSYQVS